MSELKCPFCQQELDYLAEDIYGGMYCPNCKKHDLFGNEKMWQELIRTRKALEYAKDELDVISLKYHKTTPSIILIKYAEHAKAKITALEQKGE